MSQNANCENAATAPGRPAAHVPGRSSPPNLREASWDEIRAIFALEEGAIHLNTGTVGAMPHDVLEVYESVTREWTGSLRNVYPLTLYTEYREKIAKDFGIDQDELMICHNSTEGMSRILSGLQFDEGDEAITTTHECFSVLSNVNLIHNRYGVSVKYLTMPSGYDVQTEDILDIFESAITPRTKVMVFAAVTLFTGTKMPIRQLCDLAQRHGIITVVDGALLPGMLDIDLRALGMDFMSGSGSKFQCGPLGTGLLYTRNKVIPEYNPLPLPKFWPVISTWYPLMGEMPERTKTHLETANMGDYLQSAGSANIARAAALAKACEVWNEIGRKRIENHILELGRYARERTAERFGEGALYTSATDARLASPLVTFNPFNAPEDAWNMKKFVLLVDRLEEEYKIWIRWIEFDVPGSPHMHYGVRLCMHLYNSPAEIDRTLEVIDKLAREIS